MAIRYFWIEQELPSLLGSSSSLARQWMARGWRNKQFANNYKWMDFMVRNLQARLWMTQGCQKLSTFWNAIFDFLLKKIISKGTPGIGPKNNFNSRSTIYSIYVRTFLHSVWASPLVHPQRDAAGELARPVSLVPGVHLVLTCFLILDRLVSVPTMI